jgi:hypothetical protein
MDLRWKRPGAIARTPMVAGRRGVAENGRLPGRVTSTAPREARVALATSFDVLTLTPVSKRFDKRCDINLDHLNGSRNYFVVASN